MATMPRWSPDGKSVAFMRQTPQAVSIAIQPVGGLTVRELLTVDRPSGIQGPQWAPDGRALAYTRAETDGRTGVHVVDLAGSNREIAAPEGTSMFPSWSPDGRRIAFQHEKVGPRQIWAVGSGGGDAAPLSKASQELSHPQWSPKDPDRILVVVDHKNLATLSVATGSLTPLTHFDDSTSYVDYPSWSPDGSKVYFSITLKVGDLFLLEN